MLLSPRYLCFAYAGAYWPLSVWSLAIPRSSVPQLMALIAILHMVESLLILLSGRLNPMPVYVKYENQIRGGFNLQKFWPIPLIALVSAGIADPASGVMMPEWWPLLKDYDGFVKDTTYTLLPVTGCIRLWGSQYHLFPPRKNPSIGSPFISFQHMPAGFINFIILLEYVFAYSRIVQPFRP